MHGSCGQEIPELETNCKALGKAMQEAAVHLGYRVMSTLNYSMTPSGHRCGCIPRKQSETFEVDT